MQETRNKESVDEDNVSPEVLAVANHFKNCVMDSRRPSRLGTIGEEIDLFWPSFKRDRDILRRARDYLLKTSDMIRPIPGQRKETPEEYVVYEPAI